MDLSNEENINITVNILTFVIEKININFEMFGNY